jgi:predicted nucleic acid-binding protein
MSADTASMSPMSTADFFDSNILLYLPTDQTAKAERVAQMLADGGTISVQALNEFATVAFRKLGKTMPQIREALRDIRAACTVRAIDIETHEHGLAIAERYKFSIYDSMLVAAALKAGCTTFYTEDLQHGQKIQGLTIRNPFRD